MKNEILKIPQYRKLAEILRKHIVEGVYKEGDMLPSENELCTLHTLTRPTVRQALNELVNEGYIKRQQGKGSVVCPAPKGIGILSVAGTTSVLGHKSLKTCIIVKPTIKMFPDDFMFPLSDNEKESGCIYIERLRLVDDVPLFYDINYLPNINLPRFLSRSFENKSLFEILRQHYQIRIKGGEQKLRAISADEQLYNFLHVTKGHPILHVERKIETNRIGYFFYSSLYCNTELHSLYGTF